jgi:hypothetical protein
MNDGEMIDALEAHRMRLQGRRAFFKAAVGAAAVGASFAVASAAQAQTIGDPDILNFALNLEYLEANFYYYAVYGTPIPAASQSGTVGTQGAATGGRAVAFADPIIAQFAREIANDELAHVNYLRTALGSAAVAQPTIDVGVSPTGAFSSAARAAKLIGPTTAAAPTFFDPYASDTNFLLAAFIFEDVGVTAYKGASPLITSKAYLDVAAGILAAEALHAGLIRTQLDLLGVATPAIYANVQAISDARDSLDGSTDLDQGITRVGTGNDTTSNIFPTDGNGIAFSRPAASVLNIVYLNNTAVSMGGFFPAGVNGTIKTSTAQ